MSRSRHQHERGTPLGWKRWRKRNLYSKPAHVRPRDERRMPVGLDAAGHFPGCYTYGCEATRCAQRRAGLP